MKLSIIIPVYNEEATVALLIKKVKAVKLPSNVIREIIVVDDASKDNSKLKIQNAKLRFKIKNLIYQEHKKNLGKGAAVRTGIEKATGDIVLIQDADLEYDPNDYPKLIRPIIQKKAKVVYGTRLKNYPIKIFGKGSTPFLSHYFGNKLLSLATSFLYGSKVTDMETCYKVFHKSVLQGLSLKAMRFELEPEITAKILKRGFKIYEVPIKVKPRGYDEGKKISWKDGFIALWTLIKYRFTD
jgi:glycosyltransferase involved in cell wall biosynthesis